MALSLLLKVTIALVAGLAAARMLRRTTASVRHMVLASTFAVTLLLPLAAVLSPRVDVAIPMDATPLADTVARAATRPLVTIAPSPQIRSNVVTTPSRLVISPATLGVLTWAVGFLAFALPLAASLMKVRRMRARSLPWAEGQHAFNEMAPAHATDVEVLLNEGIAAPLTCGLLRPAMVFPMDASGWPKDDLERAFVHELEHIRRSDWLTQCLARIACAVYWFHPLVWMAWRRLCVECERACDDAVLERCERDVYADQLVKLARRVSTAPLEPVLPMAGRTDLSVRVRAILDSSQLRGRAGFTAIAGATVAVVLFVAGIAPLQAQRTQRPRGSSLLATSIVEAAADGRADDVRQLLDLGADVNSAVDGDGSPLIMAARRGHGALVRYLIERGADPNLAVPGDGNPLIMASRQGHQSIAALLLDAGADVNGLVQGDETPLINASAQGHLAVAELLVNRGADVNLGARAGTAPDDEWRTPLNQAVRNGHGSVAAFLRARGAIQ